MTLRKTLMGAVAATAFLAGAPAAFALDEITVGYFLEWPMPFQFAKVNGTYDKELGLKVNWRSFDTGVAMSAAMAAGDVQLSISQGVPPLVNATSAGQDLQAIEIAVSYSENDNCVVRSDLEITKDNAGELAGKKVAVPIGSAAHYGFLRQMEHFGVDVASLDVVDMAPPDSAAAFAQGNLDMACGWGGSLRRMKEHGNVLLTGAEKEALGILVFDVTSGPSSFIAENPDLVAKFLKVTEDANAMWADTAQQATMLPVIAKDSGMDEVATAETMATFTFLTPEEQLSAKWLGGGAIEYMAGVAKVFKDTGNIPAVLESYGGIVNTGPLTAAEAM
jgi:taurine transport system substrate-binding protein